jgi:hypothetical protein
VDENDVARFDGWRRAREIVDCVPVVDVAPVEIQDDGLADQAGDVDLLEGVPILVRVVRRVHVCAEVVEIEKRATILLAVSQVAR